MVNDDYRAAARNDDLRRIIRRQYRHFKNFNRQRREWVRQRDGSAGAAGPCKRLRIIDGRLLVTEIVSKSSADTPANPDRCHCEGGGDPPRW